MNTQVPHPEHSRLCIAVDPAGHVSASIKTAPQSRKRALLVSLGAITVRINKTSWYSKRHRKKYFSWALAWRDIHGKRQREKRSTLDLAKKRAEAIAQDIQTGEALLGNFAQADRAALSRARELLAPIGSPPIELVAGIYTESVQILRAAGITDLTPHDCVKFLIENRPRGAAASCHVATAVEEMLEAMERAEAGQRWIDDLRSRLTPSAKKWKQPVKPFVEHFTGPVHAALRAAALNDWLRKLKLSPRSRNNYRGAVLALAAFCKDKEYLPRTWSEMAAVKTEKIKRKRILIYEPEQCSDLLKCALPNLVPFLAIQAFAGVRTREILGDAQHTPLSWSDIRLRERQIHVPADVAKEGTPQRIIPIQENLAAWLKPYVQQKRSNGHCGSQGVCALANVTNALRRTAQRAGVPFIRNGLRKSFISYRAAVLKDIGRVADEAGNSAQIIKNHYRDVRSPEDGHRWFSIGTLQLNLDLNEEAG